MIIKSGKTAYQLSSETGVVASVISRFLSGERDIRLETAGKLAAAIGAELKTKAARK
jgi:plasmid maintenance system antidote protein VapI